MSDQKLELKVGTVVEIKDTGETSVIVGFEQGRVTVQLPVGPGGATREFFRDEVEPIKQVPLSRLYYIGRADERKEIEGKLKDEIKEDMREKLWGMFES